MPVPGLIDGGLDQDFFRLTKLFHARGMLKDIEFGLCQRLYYFLRSQLTSPDMIILLTASPTVLKQRLASRDRVNIASAKDFDLIDILLEEWVSTISQENIIRLDVSETSISYNEILPSLIMKISEKL